MGTSSTVFFDGTLVAHTLFDGYPSVVGSKVLSVLTEGLDLQTFTKALFGTNRTDTKYPLFRTPSEPFKWARHPLGEWTYRVSSSDTFVTIERTYASPPNRDVFFGSYELLSQDSLEEMDWA